MLDVVATVEKNEVFGAYGRISLIVTGERIAAEPGQFAMLRPERPGNDPLLRRAMAIYRIAPTSAGTSVEFIYQVLGPGTLALQRARPGEPVACLLPLGKPFDTSHVSVGNREALIVAGGVGASSVFMLAAGLKHRGIPVRVFLGGRTERDLIGLDDFLQLGCIVHLATDDGSKGVKGFVTVPLERFLGEHSAEVGMGKYVAFCCGPTPMMAAVARITHGANVLAYSSLEERMACGFGVCVGCVVDVKCGDGADETDYQRVCVEGPVFRSDLIAW